MCRFAADDAFIVISIRSESVWLNGLIMSGLFFRRPRQEYRSCGYRLIVMKPHYI